MTPSGVTALRMKPNFALSLSFDGIRLLHRAGASGWHLVGEVALDCEDLSAELGALREKAAALLERFGLSNEDMVEFMFLADIKGIAIEEVVADWVAINEARIAAWLPAGMA